MLLLLTVLLIGCSQKAKEEVKEVSSKTKISKMGSIDADYSIPANSEEIIGKSEDIIKIKLVQNKIIGNYDNEKM